MTGPTQTRREALQSRSAESAETHTGAEPVSEPGYSSLEFTSSEPLYSYAPETSGAAYEFPMCSIPGHEERAAATPPLNDAQQDVALAEPQMSVMPEADVPAESEFGFSELPLSEEGQSVMPDSPETETDEADAGEAPPGGARRQARTRRGERRRGRGRRQRRDGENGEADGESEIEIPELQLEALSFLRPGPMAPLNLPPALQAADKPSTKLAAIAEEEDDKRRAAAEARAYADQRYGEVVRSTEIAAARYVSETLAAARRIETETTRQIDQIQIGTQQADAQIEAAAAEADIRILAQAEERKQYVRRQYRMAMARLRRANGIAHGAAARGDRQARAHIDVVRGAYARAFTAEITTSAGEIERAGRHALERITDFRRRATRPTTLAEQNRESLAQREIQREVNKANGAGLAAVATAKINQTLFGNPRGAGADAGTTRFAAVQFAAGDCSAECAAAAAGGGRGGGGGGGGGSGGAASSGGGRRGGAARGTRPRPQSNGLMVDLAAKFRADSAAYYERLRPTLCQNACATKQTVANTLSTTFRQTSRMLRRQRDQAIETIDRQVQVARAQLGAQRHLARNTLRTQADSTVEQVSGRAVSAREGLEKASRAVRPHQETALERLQGSIAGVGMSPPEQLRKTAEIATEKVAASLAGAASVQRAQSTVIETSTIEGLNEDGTGTAAVRSEHMTGELERIGGGGNVNSRSSDHDGPEHRRDVSYCDRDHATGRAVGDSAIRKGQAQRNGDSQYRQDCKSGGLQSKS